MEKLHAQQTDTESAALSRLITILILGPLPGLAHMCCLVPRVSLGENLKGAQWVHLLSQSYSVNYGGEGDGKELSWDSKCEMKIYTITSSI